MKAEKTKRYVTNEIGKGGIGSFIFPLTLNVAAIVATTWGAIAENNKGENCNYELLVMLAIFTAVFVGLLIMGILACKKDLNRRSSGSKVVESLDDVEHCSLDRFIVKMSEAFKWGLSGNRFNETVKKVEEDLKASGLIFKNHETMRIIAAYVDGEKKYGESNSVSRAKVLVSEWEDDGPTSILLKNAFGIK